MKKKGTGTVILVAILLIVITILAALFALKYFENSDKNTENLGQTMNEVNSEPVVEKEVEIYKGTDRPIAVMIDNHEDARPQAGLNDAYAVYEITVEGGLTRLMAVFKNSNIEKIGPVRSSRHYFLDYALENDAIYVHYGWSPQAESDISTLGVNNVNGLVYSEKYFWRVKDKSAPHNVATSIEKIKELAEQKDYRLTSSQESVLKYVTDEVNLENGETADIVTIPYKSYTVKYEYDEEKQVYTRYNGEKKQQDWTTGEDITTKNIIITFAQTTSIDSSDRQNLSNIGDLNGYYITNGKAIKITCSKLSRTTKTIYKDLEGNIIEVNDGNTFFQICPINANVQIESNIEEITPIEETNNIE